MKNGTPKHLPDLRKSPEQLSDHEQELLSQRIKILEQRLSTLTKSDAPFSPKKNPPV